MSFELLHPRRQLTQIMDRLYRYRLTTTSGGNLSILDDDGSLWITPAGVDKGNLKQRDIMCIRPDGQVVGPHKPSSEHPFHRMIYDRRPDVRAIVHAHAPALISFSIARKIPNTRIIPQAHHVCGEVGYAPYALPGSWQLGENIAETFAQGFDAVLLENHGVVTAGPDLLTAFQRLETLDVCARTQIQAANLGPINVLTDEQIALFENRDTRFPTFRPDSHSSQERELRDVICRLVHRAYDQRLMTSTEGTVSARLDADSFVITPTGIDRRYVTVQDLALVRGGLAEEGKRPSRALRLHQAIYAEHPGVGCIITAQCANAVAFAVTGKPLDTKTIPESYVVLRDVPIFSYGEQYSAPEKLAVLLSKSRPVILIQNDTVLASGDSIHQAFDRLEVADFTAMSLIDTANIGPLVPIAEQDIEALKEVFG